MYEITIDPHDASAHDRERLEAFKVVYIQRIKELSRFVT